MRKIWLWGISISLLVIVLLTPVSSKLPDYIENITNRSGIIKSEKDSKIVSPFRDYEVKCIKNPWVGGVVSGAIGIVLVLGITVGLGKVLKKRE
ncbi:MAG: PDGLE domain-containing protein [Patescibacteria group bacterium]|nr:PDGLE domain-containing protein [Patescibacteria group bacterium]